MRPGTVLEADYSKARIRVALGRNKTAWLPWLTSRAGGDRTWHAPEIGEQVLVVSPSGELAQGYVLPGGVYKTDFPANGNSETISRTTYKDGAVVEYDRTAHAYGVTIPNGGKATVSVGSNSKVLVEDSDVTLSFGSGASIKVESGKITLSVGGNSIVLSSSGIATKGDISQTGKITASGDVKAGTISLQSHVHGGVYTGTSSTSTPTI